MEVFSSLIYLLAWENSRIVLSETNRVKPHAGRALGRRYSFGKLVIDFTFAFLYSVLQGHRIASSLNEEHMSPCDQGTVLFLRLVTEDCVQKVHLGSIQVDIRKGVIFIVCKRMSGLQDLLPSFCICSTYVNNMSCSCR